MLNIMKTIFLTLSLLISFSLIYAQSEVKDTVSVDTVINEKVLETFNKMFPKTTFDEWKFENNNYTITFFKDNKWYDVTFSEKGKWIETYIMIDYEDLPEKLRVNFEASKYNEYELYQIMKLDKPDDVKYKLFAVSYKNEEVELYYNEQGELLPNNIEIKDEKK